MPVRAVPRPVGEVGREAFHAGRDGRLLDDDYVRKQVALASGIDAWVYLAADD